MQKEDRLKYRIIQADSDGYKYARDGWSSGHKQHSKVQRSICLKHPAERLYDNCPYSHSRRLVWGL